MFAVLGLIISPANSPVTGPLPAAALSCAPVNLYDALRDADFVFIGSAQAELPAPPDQGAGWRRFLFTVEVWLKGDLGPAVEVASFEWDSPRIGERRSMILSADNGVLREQACLFAHPDTLLAIAAFVSEEPSGQPPALLVGGSFGDSRLMGLDVQGRLARMGNGAGTVSALASCPGGERIVELVADSAYDVPRLAAVRDAATLEIMREVELPPGDGHFAWPQSLACRDVAGEDVLVGLAGIGLLQLADHAEFVYRGSVTTYALSREQAIIGPTTDGSESGPAELSVLDLASGDETPLAQPAETSQPIAMAFSPNEARLAYVSRPPYGSLGGSMAVHLFDPASGELLSTQPLNSAGICDVCELSWLDDETLLVRDWFWGADDRQVARLRTFRLPDLELVEERADLVARRSEVGAGALFRIVLDGPARLVATSLDDGRSVDMRVLATNDAGAVLILPGFDELATAALFELPAGSPPPGGPAGSASPGMPAGAPPPGDPPVNSNDSPPGERAGADLALLAGMLVLLMAALGASLLLWRRRRRA